MEDLICSSFRLVSCRIGCYLKKKKSYSVLNNTSSFKCTHASWMLFIVEFVVQHMNVTCSNACRDWLNIFSYFSKIWFKIKRSVLWGVRCTDSSIENDVESLFKQPLYVISAFFFSSLALRYYGCLVSCSCLVFTLMSWHKEFYLTIKLFQECDFYFFNIVAFSFC